MKEIVKNRKNCTGCHACVSRCPKGCICMITDREGFDYPYVDEDSCIDCGLCERICPILNKEEQVRIPKAFACINKNEAIRKESSSGGIFSLLAGYVIGQKGIVYGASFDVKNTVEHIGVTKVDDLYQLRGSKYLQSRIGDIYCEIEERLEGGEKVYFSGTPCQVEGLLHFLPKSYNNLFCQDIICHGVPSPKVWKQYLDMRNYEHRGQTPVQINFRQKDSGWNLFELSIQYRDSSYQCSSGKDIYMKAFLSNIDLRYSCYYCQFKGLNRSSDITLADFWGIDYVLPEMNDDKGTSLVIVNSQKGSALLQGIRDKMEYKEVDINEAVKYNPAACKSVQEPKIRKHFFKRLDRGDFKRYMTRVTAEKMQIRKTEIICNILSKIGDKFNHEDKPT